MAYNDCNEWSISTPSNNGINDRSLWTASTGSIGSILRSSSRYTASKLSKSSSDRYPLTSCKKKKVSIVSPIKWEINNKSAKSLKSKREFINTTIPYCELKRILRDLGCDTRGCYGECVDRLLATNWIPNRHYIKSNEKLRAKPIQAFNDRVIKLENGEMDYLQTFPINELKKWLKFHNIDQPHGATKREYMKLININFLWRSPSPDLFRFKIRPNRPCYDKTNTKTLSRTPRQKQKMNNSNSHNDKSRLDFNECDQDDPQKMDNDDKENMNLSINDFDDNINDMSSQMGMEIGNEGLRMQLCFDD